ncbi:MAG TPA: hypothetical protein PLE99_10090 [Candidatus Thiothrix moscowensis]|uniref:T4 family baseplate hub assembly chaperone n=1 Tax=Thiothrix sp. UBA2016 TaxID=1947695 RepID=UPI0025EAD73B|nr:hypothetical protein [Thiothrix sp. UBA2016]HRJ53109.1 hypothetical protein [Candidatus Thiothrix moscowensis]HRJ93100.1 hypothetical protein [Candidatus Thiothrix moscowensis]
MHTLSAAQLLDIWEAGLGLDMNSRASLLLAAILPEQAEADLAGFSIGERDYYLLHIRQMLFGSRMVNIAQCPHCQERLEWESDMTDLSAAGDGKYPLGTALEMQDAGYQVRFRLPNSRDITLLLQQPSATASPQSLLQQCVLEVRNPKGKPISLEQLPTSSQQALSQAMEAADPLARIDIGLTCPACGNQWQALFDIAAFLWAEIQGWAERTLRSVHVLAKAYGWAEADILAMTPTRRQLYLGMVAQ